MLRNGFALVHMRVFIVCITVLGAAPAVFRNASKWKLDIFGFPFLFFVFLVFFEHTYAASSKLLCRATVNEVRMVAKIDEHEENQHSFQIPGDMHSVCWKRCAGAAQASTLSTTTKLSFHIAQTNCAHNVLTVDGCRAGVFTQTIQYPMDQHIL